MTDREPVPATIDFLRDQHGGAGQIVEHRHQSGQQAETADIDLHPSVNLALRHAGIDDLYQHQIRAIEAIRDGSNAVIATPTASGKSLAYLVPALERAIMQNTKTLYIAPYRALINDQAATVKQLAADLGLGESVSVGVQTGETSDEDRRELKDSQPDIVLTTIDQVHLSLCPWAHSPRNWKWLFQQLGTVVVDEVHMNRGYFGSHVACVFRRLNRLAEHYNRNPTYICASATIGNPIEHAATVTNQPTDSFALIDEDTSASGDRHWLLWNPPLKEDQSPPEAGSSAVADSDRTGETRYGSGPSQSAPDGGRTAPVTPGIVPHDTGEPDAPGHAIPERDTIQGGKRLSNHQQSVRLFCSLLQRGYQTLVFTTARQGAAQYVDQADQMLRERGQTELADAIHAYHAALSSERRQQLEADLQEGTARGVWSTNALELGIDIGTLDAVILDGYPGTVMSTFQRAGRAGRGTDDALVILVGSDNPLDQYIMRDPSQLFDAGAEQAIVNPANDSIRPDHIVCAAADSYLTPNATVHFGDDASEVVTELANSGRLQRVEDDTRIRWESTTDSPQWDVNIRGIGSRAIDLYDRARDRTFGELEYRSALRDAHPEALYTHAKQTYRVAQLDLRRDRAELEPVETEAYTQPLTEKDITIQETLTTGILDLAGFEVPKTLARMTVSEELSAYLYHTNPGDDEPTKRYLDEDLPPAEIDTVGLFLEIPSELADRVREAAAHPDQYLNALHAVEHALISVFPRAVLCDRRDIGGLSTESHGQTVGGTIFVHDGHPGGAGFCRAAFEELDSLIEETQQLIDGCTCEQGCPSCIHSPHCGNANRHLSKRLASVLLAGSEQE
jgi:DEAD/DEAH box helicase domain-containing protein